MYLNKLNFNKNKLINEVLQNYYNTFSVTLDTEDFVEAKFNNKIHKYIFKNLKKQIKKIDKEDKKYQKEFKKELDSSMPKKKGLFKRKTKTAEEKAIFEEYVTEIINRILEEQTSKEPSEPAE